MKKMKKKKKKGHFETDGRIERLFKQKKIDVRQIAVVHVFDFGAI